MTRAVSVQQVVAVVHDERDRDEVTALAQRRFGYANPAIGTTEELVDHFGRMSERGVERTYTWFADFARAETLDAFGASVIPALAAGR